MARPVTGQPGVGSGFRSGSLRFWDLALSCRGWGPAPHTSAASGSQGPATSPRLGLGWGGGRAARKGLWGSLVWLPFHRWVIQSPFLFCFLLFFFFFKFEITAFSWQSLWGKLFYYLF